MEYGIYIGLATLFVVVIAHAVRVTWKVRDVEIDIRDDMNAQIDNVQRDIALGQREHLRIEQRGLERADGLRHEFGEVATALRTKIHETETWNRDTFVRKDSFEMVIGRLEKSIEKLGDKIENKLDRFLKAKPD